MRVYLLKADLGGSGAYRIDEPARVVRNRHPNVEITVSTDIDIEGVRYRDGRVEVTSVKADPDVLVIQRPLTQQISEVARVARAQGIKIVVDIDDDFHNVHPSNIAAKSVDPHEDPWHNRLWLNRSVGLAHVVTVSTPALLKYGQQQPGGGRGVVLRNRIPERALLVRGDPGVAARIGWTGTMQTHPTDMSHARGVLDATDEPLVVVGDREGIADALRVDEERVELGSGWVDGIDKYWQAIVDSFGIGIAPLEANKFNKAKSWLKPAEYCALGIPYVVSPVSEYRELTSQSRAGYTAASPTRWAVCAREAIDRRDELAAAGRAWAREHTLEAHADDWYRAWEKAANS